MIVLLILIQLDPTDHEYDHDQEHDSAVRNLARVCRIVAGRK
jgi:hypothetical protein